MEVNTYFIFISWKLFFFLSLLQMFLAWKNDALKMFWAWRSGVLLLMLGLSRQCRQRQCLWSHHDCSNIFYGIFFSHKIVVLSIFLENILKKCLIFILICHTQFMVVELFSNSFMLIGITMHRFGINYHQQ
jgi:hypothetical protein